MKSDSIREEMRTGITAGGAEPSDVFPQRRRFRIANAPCSWGSLEFDGLAGEQIAYSRMLDELVETGYEGTELGDWGYMPTDPEVLRDELDRRGVALVGAFVPVRLRDPASHAGGMEHAMAVARLLRDVARGDASQRPLLILSDDNGSDRVRVRNAGRIDSSISLSNEEMLDFAAAAERIARAVLEETAIRSAFHHHCAGFVETPAEIEQFLQLTDPDLIGLVFDTGHYAFGAGGCGAIIEDFGKLAGRIRHVHFKDFNPAAAREVFDRDGDYFEAIGNGVFCELGKGCVDFKGILDRLEEVGYRGWIVVEQDVLPGMGTPAESALRNREFLKELDV